MRMVSTWLDPVLRPLERGTYRVMGVDPNKEHNWKQYTFAMLLFSLVGCLFTYAILRLQYFLPLNPQGLAGVSPDLSFNTATSFTTNTNWQSYVGETTMSYFSQMVGLAFHNFVSAATGIAFAAAEAAAIRFIKISESPRLMETWRERKFVSASSIPRCSPPSRPTHHAARSIRCMIRLRHSVDSCRCSTFS